MAEQVILVDEQDNELGTMEKMLAHREARLHRAFSVFIFDSAGRMLLQQRALDKYHSGGLFTNACCSHPRPGEGTPEAASRRLQEEMGLKADLRERWTFVYRTEFDNGLTEHEYDHVFEGVTNKDPEPDKTEVASWCWKTIDEIKKMIGREPEKFTSWFRIAMNKFY